MKTGTGPWLAGLLVMAVTLGADARGAAVWPSEPWVQLKVGALDYWDDHGDENPPSTDLIGGIDDGISYSAGAWHESGLADNDQASLRMRLDADGTGTNNIWQFLFDTDADTDADWVLEVRQSGNPSQQQVIFTAALPGGPTFGDIALDPTYAWTGALTDWSRWGAVDDGSSFGGNADFFLDAAIPLSTFYSLTGLNAGDSFSVAATTSTAHTTVNKDIPVGLDAADPAINGFADPLRTAPEPGTAGLTGMGLCWLAALRARAGRRRGRATRA